MKDAGDDTTDADVGLHGQRPALQVICLGNSGGPCEENVTAFLVRSTETAWTRGSLLAVDAGSHMGPIIRILEQDFPSVSADRSRKSSNGTRISNGDESLHSELAGASLSPSPSPSLQDEKPYCPEPTILTTGPFAGMKFPNESARANGLYLLRNYISTYLITHPHLDHISGFAINTAAFHATTKPKTLAALPSTVDAIKQHIFNDVIWPNLTDEDGGVGFVTFQRLKEGGDAMLGEGEGRGYIDVCDGLGVRAFKVSHGCCTKSPPSHHHRGSIAGLPESQFPVHGDQAQAAARSSSISHQFSMPGTPGVAPRQSFHANNNGSTLPSPRMMAVDQQAHCVVDSTAYFIRDCETQREVLIFGDVEPDSISFSPRNLLVWQEAARKIAHGLLGGVFIESSYDDSQADPFLFGHLNPRHLIAELKTLAELVTEAKAARLAERGAKKRKRSVANGLETSAKHAVSDLERKRRRSIVTRQLSQEERRSSASDHSMPDAVPSPRSQIPGHTSQLPAPDAETAESTTARSPRLEPSTDHIPAPSAVELPLSGIKVVIIHIKDTLKDGPHVSENVLAQLQEHEQRLCDEGSGLGCEFVVSRSGESYWF